MDMGIVVTGFTLFGMIALVILDASLEEPTQHRAARPAPKAQANRAPVDVRAHKHAA
jgi:hypothetical protein